MYASVSQSLKATDQNDVRQVISWDGHLDQSVAYDLGGRFEEPAKGTYLPAVSMGHKLVVKVWNQSLHREGDVTHW